MQKVLIIEDDHFSARRLKRLIMDIDDTIDVHGPLKSVVEVTEELAANNDYDLIFSDIRLADSDVFEAFRKVMPQSFVIFTTAYDEYALRAFKVNSIDYLLKPIGKEDIEHAFEKLDNLQDTIPENGSRRENKEEELLHLIHSLKKQENYKTHFLIPIKGDKLLPVSIDMIQLFYIKDCQVKAVLTDGVEYNFSLTLDELVDCLNPSLFFRVNRQFLISREAIKDLDLWFNSRLSINLHHSRMTEKILVSKARVAEFKEWFSSKK